MSALLSASTGPLSSDIAFRASRRPKGPASTRVRCGTLSRLRRGGRAVECGGLENRYPS